MMLFSHTRAGLAGLAGVAALAIATSEAAAQRPFIPHPFVPKTTIHPPNFNSQTTISSSPTSFSATRTFSITPTTPPAITTTTITPTLGPTSRTPLIVPSVAAQSINPIFRLGNGLTLPQAAFNTAVAGQALSTIPPYALGFNPYPFSGGSLNGVGGGAALSTYGGSLLGAGGYGGASLSTGGYGAGGSPYDGYGGAGYGGYYEDPFSGYLRGTADVTNSQGRFLSQVQQARLQQTQADSAKLDLRHRMIEEAANERKTWINPDTERTRDLDAAYTRATHEPPLTDVLSGRALNDLYNHVYPLQQRAITQGIHKPNVPLDEDALKQVNLTGSGSVGSVGLFKDRGKLTWPLSLQSPEYDTPRKELITLINDAVDQVRLNNPVGAATLRDMNADVRRMSDTLLHNVGELSPTDYVEAKRFLSSLESSIRALHDPNAGNQLNQNWTPRGKSVAELVDFMGQHGLTFAPATPGDEPAYRNLYQRLLAYDAGMTDALAKR
jgi:hypothetical protein